MAIMTPRGSGLEDHGFSPRGRVFWNPTTALLYTHSLLNGEGKLAEGGPIVVDTGRFTGRSPKDKFIVKEPESEDRIGWGAVNQPIEEESFEGLREKVIAYLEEQETIYVTDAYAGADPAHRIGVRVVTAHPYHALFSKTMFIEPAEDELTGFEPDALVLHAPGVEASPEEDGTRTETFIVLHPSRSEVVIGGTYYGGEIKKSIFSLMNDRLPLDGVLPMHCSANVDHEGKVAIFFGLSGTGKTTLSADPERYLIGDDEHGWGDQGVFNIEDGCYAKVIRLSAEAEPEIFRMTQDLRNGARERHRGRGGRARPRRRLEDREHAGGLQARADRARAPGQAGRPPELGGVPDGRRLRDPAPDRAPFAGSGALLLPLRVHGQARGHGDRRHRASADLLRLLRGAVPARSPPRSTPASSARSSTSTARRSGS